MKTRKVGDKYIYVHVEIQID